MPLHCVLTIDTREASETLTKPDNTTIKGAVRVTRQMIVTEIPSSTSPMPVHEIVTSGSSQKYYKIIPSNLNFEEVLAQRTDLTKPIQLFLEAEISTAIIPEAVSSTSAFRNFFIISHLNVPGPLYAPFIPADVINNAGTKYVIQAVGGFASPGVSVNGVAPRSYIQFVLTV